MSDELKEDIGYALLIALVAVLVIPVIVGNLR